MSYRDCTACKEAGTKPARGRGLVVSFDPRIQMPGTPTVQGHRIAAETVAMRAYHDGVKPVMEDYVLPREAVLVACWWAGLFGPRRTRRIFRESAEMAGRHLWYRCIRIPDPPREGGT